YRLEKSAVFWFGLFAVGAGCVPFGEVKAAPIQGIHKKDAAEVLAERYSRFHPWSAYLLGGPSVWTHVVHPRVTPDVETAIWHAIRSDRGERSPWIRFLLYKQSLNPTRFARFHPKVALALDRISATPVAAKVLTPTPSSNSPDTGTASPLQAQQIPEPATWLLAFGLAGWGAWWRRRAR